LFLDSLLELDLFCAALIDDWSQGRLFHAAAEVLRSKGLDFDVAFTLDELRARSPERVVHFGGLVAGDLACEVVSLDELVGNTSQPTVGERVFSFRLPLSERRQLLERLSDALGGVYFCSSAHEFMRMALLLRDGSWQQIVGVRATMAFLEGEGSDDE
jgi:hypothetical protein